MLLTSLNSLERCKRHVFKDREDLYVPNFLNTVVFILPIKTRALIGPGKLK